MRRTIWSQASRRDFRNITDHLAERNPIAADTVSRRLLGVVEALAQLPTGRPGRLVGTYERIVTGLPYIVAYELGTDADGSETVFIIRIIHGARDWTRDRWPED